jgi:UDP-N-acetyl-2-amino-2-deoxyglucuronate dehydrogenase
MHMLNFAIIGCGRIAQRHAEQAAAAGKLVAVCDIDESRALSFAKQFNATPYIDFEELLQTEKNLDLVAICTPNGLHAKHTISALRAGFHVVCEKPMALHASDCEQMITQAKEAGKQLFIVKQNRFNPPVVAVKKLLDEGRLGVIYSLNLECLWYRDADYYQSPWKGTRAMDGGTLYTQFSHFIDLLYWFAGDVKKITAFTANFAHQHCIEFEDTGVANMQFEQGALGSLHFTINSYKKNSEGSLMIIAEKGTVKIGGEYLNTIEYQQIEGSVTISQEKGNAANEYGTYTGSMSNHNLFYHHVTEVIAGRAINAFDGHDGLKIVEIIEKIYKAANGSHD